MEVAQNQLIARIICRINNLARNANLDGSIESMICTITTKIYRERGYAMRRIDAKSRGENRELTGRNITLPLSLVVSNR
jgi:hypothetical protein